MTLRRFFALVLLAAPLSTAASAQCSDVGQQLESAYHQWQSAQSANSEAEKEYSACTKSQAQSRCNSKPSNEAEYSACVENQGRLEDQAHQHCNDEYSKMQSAKKNLEAAVSDYEDWRQNDCVQQPGGFFGKTRPLGVWPPAR
jgi:chromosome segregation ATPase